MKKTAVICIFLLSCLSRLPAQINTDSVSSSPDLVDHPDVQALKAPKNFSFNDVLKLPGWAQYDSSFKTTPEKAIWIRFKLKNTTDKPAIVYLYSNDNYIDFYQQKGKSYRHFRNGYLTSLKNRSNKKLHFFTGIELQAFTQSELYIKLSSDYKLVKPNYPVLYTRIQYLNALNRLQESEAHSIGFIYLYLISLCCIFIFVLVFCIRLQKRLYFYYLGYIFFQILYGFSVLSHTPATVANFGLYFPGILPVIFEPVQFAFIGFYIFFILHLLEIRKFDRRLANVLRSFGVFCFTYSIFRLLFNYYWKDLETGELLFTIVRMIVLPLNLILFFWIIYKARHPLRKYFIIGQSCFFAGALVSSYISYTEIFLIPGSIFNFPHSQNIIFQAGLLAEVFCFSIALGENVFLIQKEKENTSQKLIAQLKQNQIMEENMRKELDKQVNQKTEELVQLYSEIEKQKEEQIKKSFSERLRNMKMLALRSQMNPHFIFNSLNALKNLVMMSREEDAIQYLDNFSVLLRTILQNSSKNTISVEDELEMLELYLSLEKKRLGENFSYNIQYTSREALSQYSIPPLLLQPFVENAIWHGLQPSMNPEKRLTVNFNTEKQLQITIEDNGIGRVQSSKTKRAYPSAGTNITRERLSLYNHISDSKMNMEIEDLEKNGLPAGTRITITYNE